jgi:hypothetical protein
LADQVGIGLDPQTGLPRVTWLRMELRAAAPEALHGQALEEEYRAWGRLVALLNAQVAWCGVAWRGVAWRVTKSVPAKCCCPPLCSQRSPLAAAT